MSKRVSSDSGSIGKFSKCPALKKRRVSFATFQKWRTDLDRECNTLSWLDCECSGQSSRKIVEKLKCKVCTQYEPRIMGMRNYSEKWISGADSVRTSNIRDHSNSDHHKHATLLLKRDQARESGLDTSSFAIILKVLNQMSEKDKEVLRIKFDIVHFIATQQLAFTNYPSLCELE